MNLKEATKNKACCNCKHCKRKNRRGLVSCRCEKHGANLSYALVMEARCDDWEVEE